MERTFVADNVRTMLAERGYKHSAIAERAGYTRQQFSDMLNGRKLILADDCIKLCNAIGCTYDDLFRIPKEK